MFSTSVSCWAERSASGPVGYLRGGVHDDVDAPELRYRRTNHALNGGLVVDVDLRHELGGRSALELAERRPVAVQRRDPRARACERRRCREPESPRGTGDQDPPPGDVEAPSGVEGDGLAPDPPRR